MVDNKILEITAKLFYRTIISRIIESSLAGLSEEDKLTQVQLVCLRYVHLHPEPSVGEIADGLAISNAASAKLIDRLVKRQLLMREEDLQDRRVLKITLTPKGKSVLEKVTALETKYFDEIIGRMSREEITALQNGMRAFLKAALVNSEDIDEVCLLCGWEHMLECPGNLWFRELTGKDRTKV